MAPHHPLKRGTVIGSFEDGADELAIKSKNNLTDRGLYNEFFPAEDEAVGHAGTESGAPGVDERRPLTGGASLKRAALTASLVRAASEDGRGPDGGLDVILEQLDPELRASLHLSEAAKRILYQCIAAGATVPMSRGLSSNIRRPRALPMNTVNTPQGAVTLLPPPVELLRAIRSLLPFGVFRHGTPQSGASYGIVMQCGDQEIYAVKQQPAPCSEEQGNVSFQANNILIAHSIAGYLRNGFSGLLMPCAYIRKKDAGQVESGIAYIGAPSPQGFESQKFPYEAAYDHPFGHGFTTMMVSFIRALEQSSRDTEITLFQPIGLDVRPRSYLGSIGFGFMVVGPHVVCLKTRVSEQDPTWTVLRDTGISEVFHMPSVPACINESDLHIAKSNA